MKVLIVSNGDIKDLSFLLDEVKNHQYIICTDGAAKYLKEINTIPHLLVGDFDSISEVDLLWAKSQGSLLKTYPEKKDYTDTELAIFYGMDLNPDKITIIGGMGSRWDHSIGNVTLLYKLLEKGVKGEIINESNRLTITDTLIEIEGAVGDTISIIPLSLIVKGVTIKGMEYPLDNYDLYMGSTIGISNRLISDKAYIEVKEGVLLVFITKE